MGPRHASQYGIDPDKMGLTGASAGGHLACLTVVSTPAAADGKIDQPFQAVAVFFPPTDLVHYKHAAEPDKAGEPPAAERRQRMRRAMVLAPGEPADKPLDEKEMLERLRKISPALLVDRKQPPFLLVHGDADPVVPLQQSEVLIAALKKAGGSAELIVKHGGGHAWLTIPVEITAMANWFDKQLNPAQSH